MSEDFIAEYSYDIRALPIADATCDLVICYHILEHIDDDNSAIQELYRVTRPGGLCLIQTPFKSGDIYEDSSILSPEDREKHFGQKDHCRIYSVAGLKARLEKCDFYVKISKYEEKPDNINGFNTQETVIFCTKPAN